MLVKLTSFAIQLDLFIRKCGTNFVFITLDDKQNSVSQSILILTIWDSMAFCLFNLRQYQKTSVDFHFLLQVYIFWEGHKILRNLNCRFDWHYTGQIYGGGFAKLCDLLRIYELYFVYVWRLMQWKWSLRSKIDIIFHAFTGSVKFLWKNTYLSSSF